MRRVSQVVLILFVSALLFLVIAFLPAHIPELRHFEDDERLRVTAVPLWINGNAGFADYPGSGNETHPYIIADLLINGISGLYCIRITHTNVFFVVQNCTLTNASAGLDLVNITHGMIYNNTISHQMIGIRLDTSLNNTITECIIKYNYFGVHLSHADNNTLLGNTIIYNGLPRYAEDLPESGVYLSGSHNNTIESNNISYNGLYGLKFSLSHDNTIKKNTLHCNGDGAWSETFCTGNSFTGNDVVDCKAIRGFQWFIVSGALLLLSSIYGIRRKVAS